MRKWIKYPIVIEWGDLTPNEFEMPLKRNEFELLQKIAEKSNKMALTEDMPYIQVYDSQDLTYRK